jgi:hypothetical protein
MANRTGTAATMNRCGRISRSPAAAGAQAFQQTFTVDDEIKFDRAWKNGVWHCLACVVWLVSPESFAKKALWLGQITSVNSADLSYTVVGERHWFEPVGMISKTSVQPVLRRRWPFASIGGAGGRA